MCKLVVAMIFCSGCHGLFGHTYSPFMKIEDDDYVHSHPIY